MAATQGGNTAGRVRQVFVLLLIASVVPLVGKALGRANDCAPQQHDGQCGLASGIGDFLGAVGAIAVLLVGFIVLAVKWSKDRPEEVPIRLRRTARVFLFDESGDLLLIRFVAPREDGPFIFWVTPGGEVEPNEPDRAAAERELFEELGIRPLLIGPVHEETGGSYIHLGEHVRNYDIFFAARCERSAPHLTGVTADEIALMQEARWWRLADLLTTSEILFPTALEPLARRAQAQLISANLGPEQSDL